MNIFTSTTINKQANKTGRIYFVNQANEQIIKSLLPENLASDNIEKWTEPDKTYFFQTPSQLCTTVGFDTEIEKFRVQLHKHISKTISAKLTGLEIVVIGFEKSLTEKLAFAAGEISALSTYKFNLYFKEKENNPIETVSFLTDIEQLDSFVKSGYELGLATNIARDLVNEPPNVLTAVEMANRAAELGSKYGFSVQILEQSRIESLRMGGLMAVNRGSQTPPTFSILEWKPENIKSDQKPIVLVGKGVTFDTGGLSLKPTTGSMDSMKSDMAGAAAVIGAFCAIAALKLPIHVIGLIPATDNRPGENAYTPNDVITMYDGTTVEVLNTDAEGRMILADALAFAKQYDPALVIDLATLTGAAVVAVGEIATVLYSNASREITQAMIQAGNDTYERLVEFPLWPEYKEMLKSDIADLKNVGPKYAGSITAAKFLEHFTAYPWMHLDIAGPAYLSSSDAYRPKNGTGVGVRLLVQFLTSMCK
jgi:leucyl aminopeptidase